MSETYRKSKSALYNGIEIIKENYISLVNELSKTYKDIIKRVVYEKISSMPEEKIELVIDEYLLNDLKMKGYRNINQKAAQYEFSLENLDKMNSNNKNNTSAIKIFESDIERNSGAHLNFLDEVNNEFKRTLTNKILNYYNVFYGVNDRSFENALDDINYRLTSELHKIGIHLEEKYQQLEKEQMKKVSEQIIHNYNNKTSLREEETKQFEQIANYNGYHIKEELNNYYAVNEKEKHQLNLTSQNGQSVLVTKKRDLAFKLGDNYVVSANKFKDNMIVIQQNKFYMCNMNRTKSVIVEFTPNGVRLYQNDKEATEDKKKFEILEEIKNKCPKFYNEIKVIPEIGKIIENNNKKELEELKGLKNDINSMFLEGTKKEEKHQDISSMFLDSTPSSRGR